MINISTPLKSNPESKSVPFISSVWALSAMLGAVMYEKRNKGKKEVPLNRNFRNLIRCAPRV